MKIIRRILLVICLAVFLYSAGNLAKIGYKYHKLDSDNKKLQEEVVTEVKQDSPLDRKIDFNQLKSINEDIVGWIYIPNTNIDYALLKGKTNDTYIHTNYEKKYSFGGSIFLDEDNDASMTDSNTIIYGHNMKNGRMFAPLMKFKNKECFDKHQIIEFVTPNEKAIYHIICVAKVKADDSWYSFIEDSGESHYNEKIKELYSKSLYHSDYEFGYNDEFLTLSTCEYSQNDGRLIVVAVKEGANSNV